MDPITQMNNADAIGKVYQNQNANTMNPITTADANKAEMGGDAFLKLFIESLKIQDPTAPMEQAQMMEQLTQLTMIETVTKMQGAVEQMIKSQGGVNPIGEYIDLIGKKVKVETDTGEAEGLVISVGKQGDTLMFEMADGTAHSVASIVGVTSDSDKVVEPSNEQKMNGETV